MGWNVMIDSLDRLVIGWHHPPFATALLRSVLSLLSQISGSTGLDIIKVLPHVSCKEANHKQCHCCDHNEHDSQLVLATSSEHAYG